MKITFLGAAETVTGSSYLVELNHTKFLVDHGMFQGSDELENRNTLDYTFNPAEIDFVVITHAHVDHSGLIPKLTSRGFRGEIYMTPPTRELVEILLMDSAKLQEASIIEDSKIGRDKAFNNLPTFIYSTKDALESMNYMRTIDFEERVEINDEVNFKLVNAGHILGAASIQFTLNDNGSEKILVFSGDLGHDGQDIVRDKTYIEQADFVVMESLYGGKLHELRKDSTEHLIKIINETTKNGGNVIIPVFAVQRTQEMLFELRKMKKERSINSELDVFLDSPLADKATQIYRRNYRYLSNEFIKLVDQGKGPLDFYKLHITKSSRQSIKIKNSKGCVIMAGSGMCNGGRVVSHLLNNLGSNRNSVAFVGFQAEDTLGREIIQRNPKVQIYDKEILVRAQIYDLLGFSAHADKQDLAKWVGTFDRTRLKRIILSHAELDQSLAFQEYLNNNGVVNQIAKWKEVIEL